MKFLRILTVATACLFAFSLFAEPSSADKSGPQLYQVEMIVFSHITASGLDSEQWPQNPAMPSLKRAYQLQSNNSIYEDVSDVSEQQATSIRPYQILPTSYYSLQSALLALLSKPDYQIMVHTGWLQPGLPVRNSRRIHIYGGSPLTSSNHPTTGLSPLDVLDTENSGDVTPYSQLQDWQLNGYVRVSKPYLFQFDANLILTLPDSSIKQTSANADNIKTNQFILNQTFRMRLGQVYYIDHPLFGILAIVTKYPPKG